MTGSPRSGSSHVAGSSAEAEPAGTPNGEMRGTIFNIERYAVHDGPGIRTLVFLKGCPLGCRWCQNPEGQSLRPELAVFPDLCIGCGRCVDVCPTGAAGRGGASAETDWAFCTGCLRCAAVCPAGARRVMGRSVSAGEILDEVMKDEAFYRRSGGGVTLSGGDPVAQVDFSERILELSRREGLSTAVETCGYADWKALRRLVRLADTVLFDIKHMDPQRHSQGTGVDNELVLANARRVARASCRLIVRVPVVPGYNDSEANIRAVARFARGLEEGGDPPRIELLPYHTLGVKKYERMGKSYALSGLSALKESDVLGLVRVVEQEGLECRIV